MSIWPETSPPHGACLSGAEGELVSVTISVEPQALERLLEALAETRFPINPDIYHTACVARVYPDGHEEVEPTTIVEFPAYSGRLREVRELLQQRGFDPAIVWAHNMLDEIHSGFCAQPAPPGAPYKMTVRRKHALAAC